ncbi:DUF4097 family beta strand repeat-containing protein [Lacihabitans sp. CS3-21]|uniref:DUF4097 family beta strand repeat-containing protein n=1 Tax=Lacihabitans sp. CS3-21 TaxID=2487332 RepID=UPI0020CEE230|nr:DUF4097 family beta strand repeat-containing protein [Lacihabitans sp. CS3-21]MCP9749123.1 hypothetical protein [Lacihabitans sp. CS3-21]
MKIHKIIFAVLLLSVAIPFFAKSQEKEQLTIPLSDPNKEGKLNVGIITGSIKVIGYAGKEVVIDAISVEKNHKKQNQESEGMKRINSNDGFELTAKEKNNTVNVGVDNVNMHVNLTIKVPHKFSLKVSTINNGDISIENVVGNLEISNINGFIKMKNVGGSVVANTINKDILVNFTEITPNTPMAFTTLNGKVDVTFPGSLKANVKLKTDMGDVFTDFDIDVDKTSSKINQSIDKENGLYKIKKDDWTYGKINGGGSEIMMKTMQGNIYIRKVK